MTSPPRRMTRARAKQEGFEPDWRINPHWKTPKKPTAKSLRFALPDKDRKNDTESVIFRGAQRVPSPTKIRLPIQRSPESLPSGTAACPEPHEVLRKSVLGSPVRVRPRTDHIRNPAIDKENSPLETLSTWSSPKKAGVLKTPSVASPSRPLEPTTSNMQQHSASVKILSTPIRVLNPHTPGRHLGSARRIPIKLDKARPKSLNLHPIADLPDPQPLHDSTYPASRCPPSPNKTTVSIMRKPTSPLKLHQNRELEFIDPIPKKPVRISQPSSVPAPRLATSPQQSPDSTHWTPLKRIRPLERKMSSSTHTPQLRPSKGLQQRSPSLQVTKSDFYVDESFSSPLKTNSGSSQRSTSEVPKFPIRRRSISQPTPLTDGSHPSKALSDEVHPYALKEFSPTKKIGKWKPPVKATLSAQIRRVHNDIRTERVMSPASTNSTTPNGTPQPRSPKVFDLSDSEDAGLYLFTPKQPKPTSHRLSQTAQIVNASDTALLEIRNIQGTDKVHVPRSTVPSMQTPTRGTNSNCGNDSPRVFERMPEYQRDITVPIKDACLGNLTTEINPSSTLLYEKSHCVDKRSTKPLHGVVAYVDVRTADGDDAGAPFADTLRTLGAKVVRHWTWNGEEAERTALTHVIFKEGGPRTLSKVKMAKGAVKCVGLGWISRCEAEGQRVDETPFAIEMPSGVYGHKRRKSMEPRALISGHSTSSKDQKVKDKNASVFDTAQRALSELSLNEDIVTITPTQSVSLHLARRKSLQHAPIVSSPLARKSWTISEPQYQGV